MPSQIRLLEIDGVMSLRPCLCAPGFVHSPFSLISCSTKLKFKLWIWGFFVNLNFRVTILGVMKVKKFYPVRLACALKRIIIYFLGLINSCTRDMKLPAQIQSSLMRLLVSSLR